jgi:hypothetical protein
MTISFARGLPPDVIHQLLFSFHHYEVNYANSTQLMLAMPNAVGRRPLGDMLALHRLAAHAATPLPAMRFAGVGAYRPLRALPAKTAALAAAGGGQ